VFSARDARRYCAAASTASSKLATGAGNSTIVSISNQCRTSSGAGPAGNETKNFPAAAAGGSGKIAGMAVSSGGIIGSPGDARQGATAAQRGSLVAGRAHRRIGDWRLLCMPRLPNPLPF
jgi:hypothetical protein